MKMSSWGHGQEAPAPPLLQPGKPSPEDAARDVWYLLCPPRSASLTPGKTRPSALEMGNPTPSSNAAVPGSKLAISTGIILPYPGNVLPLF